MRIIYLKGEIIRKLKMLVICIIKVGASIIKVITIVLAIHVLFSTILFGSDLKSVLKESLIEGHSSTCVPVIRGQLGSGYKLIQIEKYCLCLGKAYFSGFSNQDNKYLQTYSSLPPKILKRRQQIQQTCNLKYLK